MAANSNGLLYMLADETVRTTLLDVGHVLEPRNRTNNAYATPLLRTRQALLVRTPRSELRVWPAGFNHVLVEWANVFTTNARMHARGALHKMVKQSLEERLVRCCVHFNLLVSSAATLLLSFRI